MEWLEHSEHIFGNLVNLGVFILELCSFLCIVIGFIQVVKLVIAIKRRHHIRFPFIEVRLRFGIWLSLALEFQLAADILLTTSKTNLQSIANLASIAVIRTFLNYFLNKELEEEIKWKEKNQE